MGAGMDRPSSPPMEITPELVAKCSGPNQFENFDRLARKIMSRPKTWMLRDEAPPKRKPKAKK